MYLSQHTDYQHIFHIKFTLKNTKCAIWHTSFKKNANKATPTFNQGEQALCSDSTIKRDEYGRWIVDKTRYTKPSQGTLLDAVKICFVRYRTLLKSAFDGKGQMWITFQISSTGSFKNAEVIIWAEPSIYRQIPPEVLCGFLNVLDDLQFTIPPEYQCISDHYFRYSVFFKDL